MRKVAVVTGARSDYGILRPLLRKIQIDPELELNLVVTGMHLSSQFGLTVREIKSDGFAISERVEMLVSSDTPEGIGKSIGLGMIGFSQCWRYLRPDVIVVLGDRFEIIASVLAAVPYNIPIAHLHGGEITQGAMDESLRHAITKFSHLHFVATKEYARRVVQLGEEPWRVMVTGALSLDNLCELSLLSVSEMEARFELDLSTPPLLVTFHSVTLEHEQVEWQIDELIAALQASRKAVVFTMPNADTGNQLIAQKIRAFVQSCPHARLVDNFGTQGYFSMMNLAAAMVGNSSSGVIEAASFGLPVVNIGTRQQGRVRGRNVVDVGYTYAEILEGIQLVLNPEFRSSLRGLENPYGGGNASNQIVEYLKQIPLDKTLLMKAFYDITV